MINSLSKTSLEPPPDPKRNQTPAYLKRAEDLLRFKKVKSVVNILQLINAYIKE